MAPAVGVALLSVQVPAADHLESAFGTMRRDQAGALIVLPAPLFVSEGPRIAEFAVKHRLPTMFAASEFLPARGLMAYGASRTDLMHRAAGYVDKILRGAKLGDLPIEQPTKFELVINLKTAEGASLCARMSETVPTHEITEEGERG